MTIVEIAAWIIVVRTGVTFFLAFLKAFDREWRKYYDID